MRHPFRDPARPAGPSRRTVLAMACASLATVPLFTPSHAAAASARATGLDDPAKKEIAMQLVSSAENSSLDWKAQYRYIEDIGDGRGYTAGIIGFCSGTGDMLDLVELYGERSPGNVLAPYLPALRRVDGSDSHEGLDPASRTTGAGPPTRTRSSAGPRTTSGTACTSTRPYGAARRTGCGRWGSSRTTTRW